MTRGAPTPGRPSAEALASRADGIERVLVLYLRTRMGLGACVLAVSAEYAATVGGAAASGSVATARADELEAALATAWPRAGLPDGRERHATATRVREVAEDLRQRARFAAAKRRPRRVA